MNQAIYSHNPLVSGSVQFLRRFKRFMSRLLTANGLVLCALLSPLSAGANDRQEVESLAMQFALGFWRQNTDQVLNTLHPDLSKKGVKKNWRKSKLEVMDILPPDRLEILSVHFNVGGRLNGVPSPKVLIHHLTERLAVIELVNDVWFDFFHAVKINGRWRLLNCVYGSGKEYPLPKNKADTEAINAVLSAYARGLSGEPDEFAKATHIGLERRKLAKAKNNGAEFVMPIAREQTMVGALRGQSQTRELSIHLYNHTNRVAVAKLDVGDWTEQVQLLKINGKWLVVNSFIDESSVITPG